MKLPSSAPPTPLPTRGSAAAPARLARGLGVSRLLGVGWRTPLLWAGLLLLLVLGNMLSLWLAGNHHTLDVGYRADRHYLEGFFRREVDAQGRDYRWSTAQAMLRISGFPAPAQASLELNLGGLPATASVPRPLTIYLSNQREAAADATPWLVLPLDAAPRRYQLLLPPDALRDGRLYVGLHTEASSVPPDRREVGFRLDSFSVGWAAGVPVLPAWHVLAVQAALVLVAGAVGWRLHPQGRTAWLLGLGLVVGLAAMTGLAPFEAAAWQQRLLVAGLAILGLVVGLYPRLHHLLPAATPAAARRELGILLLLTLVLLAVRLLAALYPTFDSHDWYIHEERQHLFQWGNLLLFDKPAEFSRQIAIVPPAFYILVAPLSLLTLNTVPTTQGLYMFFDGVSLLALALLVRWLGGGKWAGRLALLLLGLLPIQYTALWWGFGPQVIGQALILILAVFVMQPRMPHLWQWLLAGLLLCVLLLTHNGVALLGGIWLGGYVVLDWLFSPTNRGNRLRWIGLGAGTAMLAVLLLYIDVIQLQLTGVAENERIAFTAEDIFRVKWTLGSLCASWQPLAPVCDQFVPGTNPATVLPQIGVTLISLLVPLTSLLVLVVQTHWRGRRLVLPWIGSAALFLAVDLATGLQVRYAYFLTPLVCAGLAVALEGLLRRHRRAWVVVLAVLLLVGVAGLGLWYSGVVAAIKPSLRPLTH